MRSLVVVSTSPSGYSTPIRTLPASISGAKIVSLLRQLEIANPNFRYHTANVPRGYPKVGERISKTTKKETFFA